MEGELTPGEMVAELTAKLERAEYLMTEAARLVQQTAPPRVATRLLIQVRDYIGANRFTMDVLN